jgi:hypothetical protein
MNKYSDPGSGIKHPGSATLLLCGLSLCCLQIWEDFIVRIDEKVGTKVLIDQLIRSKILNEHVSDEVKEYTAAWIVVLTEALHGRCDSLPALGRAPPHGIGPAQHDIGPAQLESWLSSSCWPPHRLLGQLLPCFAELAGLTHAQLAQLRSLLAIAAGDTLLQVQLLDVVV